MKIGLTTNEYSRHGQITVPCDESGKALGANLPGMDVTDGAVTARYLLDESVMLSGVKFNDGSNYHFSTSNKRACAKNKIHIEADTAQSQAIPER